jgi:benzoyl-CoA reductase/2-hydroxyglutaryl-CoA dehydratase subunit BcrC/BadD/HgdB
MGDNFQIHRMVYEVLKAKNTPGRKVVAQWLGGILDAVEHGKPIAYHAFTQFSELMVALDIRPLCCEAWDMVGVQADPDHAIKSIDIAHEAGIPDELCSFDKALIGSVLRKTIPPPTMITVSAMPCQNAYITYQAVSHLTGAPMYVCDTPYNTDEEGAMEYWISQYKEMIAFLEEHSGNKMDYDRLKEVVAESNRCVEYWLEAMELMKLKPAPRSGQLDAGTQTGMMMFGTPEGTAWMKYLRDKIKDKVAKDETAVSDEKLRVIWYHFPVVWDNKLMRFMTELGAVVPYVHYDDFRVEPVDISTPEKMLKGMAWRALQAPMGKLGRGAFAEYIEDLLYVVEEWKGDCVIIGAHPGCKWIMSAQGLIRDACRERQIPLLIYDIDLVDRRITSAEESRMRIEQFLTTVIDR